MGVELGQGHVGNVYMRTVEGPRQVDYRRVDFLASTPKFSERNLAYVLAYRVLDRRDKLVVKEAHCSVLYADRSAPLRDRTPFL